MEIKNLISKEDIRKKVKEIADNIKKEYPEEIFCIVVLIGAKTFFNDLEKELKSLDVKVEHAEIKISSYKGTESTGKLQIKGDLPDITGKHILIVEDIIDSGLTLKFLKKFLYEKGAEDVKICAFTDKKARRKHEVKVDYVGFEIPDKFVVGYGMDYDEKYRELDYIGYIVSSL